MSTIGRTIRNLRQVGVKDYFKQMLYIGDTKFGRLVGTDISGNKFYENMEELPLRHRWVEYAVHDHDAGQIEPGWHAWISHLVDTPPNQDPLLRTKQKPWEVQGPLPNFSQSNGAFKTYSTTAPKLTAWEPVVAPRK